MHKTDHATGLAIEGTEWNPQEYVYSGPQRITIFISPSFNKKIRHAAIDAGENLSEFITKAVIARIRSGQ